MKMDKRECRASADPGLKMKTDNGILHAEQVDYIIRTTVKIIDHHKIFILYVYSRGQAAQGDCRPMWTVFQYHEKDYATLERKEDGSVKWRSASFERLGGSWAFPRKCAFYSARDEARVASYFKSSPGRGLAPLLEAQRAIQERRRRER